MNKKGHAVCTRKEITMGPHLFLREEVLKQRQQALLAEREQQRLARLASADADRLDGDVRHVIALLGFVLVALGTRLQQVEPVLSDEQVMRRATVPLK
jgi:hypothetical protein